MASSRPASAPSLTLDQLIALNDEIAALVRVGVPLGPGLEQLGSDLPGASGKAASFVAERLDRGLPLDEILAQNPAMFPPSYRAAVMAGVRSGRIGAALEAIGTSARRLADARRLIAASLIYPITVLLLAWGLFLFFVMKCAPSIVDLIDEFSNPGWFAMAGKTVLVWMRSWSDTAYLWGPGVPLVIVLAAVVWWLGSRNVSVLESQWADAILGWLPWTRRMLRLYRTATFADLLATLLEQCVPLDESIVLAADATGGPKMRASAKDLAEAIRRGDPLDRLKMPAGFPPLLSWLMVSGFRRGSLAPTLRQAAEAYHQRAEHQSEKARTFVPVFLALTLGGILPLFYALLVLGSWFSVLQTLADSV